MKEDLDVAVSITWPPQPPSPPSTPANSTYISERTEILPSPPWPAQTVTGFQSTKCFTLFSLDFPLTDRSGRAGVSLGPSLGSTSASGLVVVEEKVCVWTFALLVAGFKRRFVKNLGCVQFNTSGLKPKHLLKANMLFPRASTLYFIWRIDNWVIFDEER